MLQDGLKIDDIYHGMHLFLLSIIKTSVSYYCGYINYLRL